MTDATKTAAKVPRGLPPEQPVELVAVSSRAGRAGVALLVAILLAQIVTIYVVWHKAPDTIILGGSTCPPSQAR